MKKTTFIMTTALSAAITFAPLAHAMPAGDICDSAKCDQMFLSRGIRG